MSAFDIFTKPIICVDRSQRNRWSLSYISRAPGAKVDYEKETKRMATFGSVSNDFGHTWVALYLQSDRIVLTPLLASHTCERVDASHGSAGLSVTYTQTWSVGGDAGVSLSPLLLNEGE